MPWRTRLRAVFHRERLAIWLIGLLLIGFALFIGFAGTPYTAPEETVERVAATNSVSVSEAAGGYVLSPPGRTPETALIFYPGARVDPSAYVDVFGPVVKRTDLAVYVPKPRLNLAVFEPRLADRIIGSQPDNTSWYVGGHSLGGAMACRYAASNPETVDGVVLFGSYCDRSIADTDLAVLSVGGTRDTVLGTDRAALRPENLPDSATIRWIEGANHTYFGSYAGQPGDSPATITRERAHELLRDSLVDFFEQQRQTARSPASVQEAHLLGEQVL